MKNCINCGHELEDSARFCEECGAKQEEPKKICPTCGKELPGKAKFCSNCGTAFSEKPATAQSPAASTKQTKNASPTMISGDVEVSQPDEDTISINIKGIPFNLKLVEGEKYGSVDEIKDFFMGETPVTQALWMTIMDENPSKNNENLQYPVTHLQRSHVTSFLIKLEKLTGLKFELPTKTQWRFARKGGIKSKHFVYSGSNTFSDVAWDDEEIHPVGELYPNEIGIKDMDGCIEEYLKNDTTEKYFFIPDDDDDEDDDDEVEEDDDDGVEEDDDYGYTMRLVLNIAYEGNKNSIVPIIQSFYSKAAAKIEKGFELQTEERKELSKTLKSEIEQKYLDVRYNGGTLYYPAKRDIRNYVPIIFGKDYEDHIAEEKKIFEKTKKCLETKNIRWETFGVQIGEPKYTQLNKNIKYTLLNNDTLVIKGEGRMPLIYADYLTYGEDEENYSDFNLEIKNRKPRIKNVIVLEGVTTVHCFSGFISLEHVILPPSIEEIGPKAFCGCMSLKFLTLPRNLEDISYGAFRRSGIKKIYIPKGIKSIKNEAFKYCNDLNIVLLPDSVTLESEVFDDCDALS